LIDAQFEEDVSYYRLKQVDFDGRQNYSNVISVSKPFDGGLIIFPVPASRVVSVLANEAISFIRLMDIRGNEIHSLKANSQTNYSLDISEVPPGIYLLEVTTSSERLMKRILLD